MLKCRQPRKCHGRRVAPARALLRVLRPVFPPAKPRIVMTKTKKTKTKAPAQAKAATEIAQSALTKPTAVAPVAATAPVQPKVRLEFSKPGAQSVAIAGSFNSWQPEQVATTGNGGWVKELAIAPGRYEYMFVVDGQWMADPNAKEYAPNPFGGQNSVLVISK